LNQIVQRMYSCLKDRGWTILSDLDEEKSTLFEISKNGIDITIHRRFDGIFFVLEKKRDGSKAYFLAENLERALKNMMMLVLCEEHN